MDGFMINAYWLCLAIGIGYTIVAFALGEFSSVIGHAGDMSGGHGGDFSHTYGVDGQSGHGTASGTDITDGSMSLGPFSPLVIAFFLTTFGASGILLSKAPVLGTLSILFAGVISVLLAWGFISFFNRVLGSMAVSSEVRVASLIGMEAEVTVAIPAQGVGEIAYIAMGSRSTAPARSEEPIPIPRYATVHIARIAGNMLYVRPIPEEQPEPLNTAAGTGE